LQSGYNKRHEGDTLLTIEVCLEMQIQSVMVENVNILININDE